VQGLACTCRCCQAFRSMSACLHMHPPPVSCTPSHHSSIKMMTSTHTLTAQPCRVVKSGVGSSLVRRSHMRAEGSMAQGKNKPTQRDSQASNKVTAVQPPALTSVTVAVYSGWPVAHIHDQRQLTSILLTKCECMQSCSRSASDHVCVPVSSCCGLE